MAEVNGNGKAPEIKELILKITFSQAGELFVDGNVINNEAMALWMLEKCKDLVKAQAVKNAMKAQPKVVRPNFLNGIRSLRK